MIRKKIKILITGGAGYIGSVMTERFLDQGFDVTCIDRLYFGLDTIKSFFSNENFNYIQKDIRNLMKKTLTT